MAELYSTLCYIEGDLSQVPKPRQYSGHLRDFYHTVQFDVILSLGLTEFKAFIAWTENVRSVLLSFPTIMNVVFTNTGQREKVKWPICSLSILLIRVAFHSGVQLRWCMTLILLSLIRHPRFECLLIYLDHPGGHCVSKKLYISLFSTSRLLQTTQFFCVFYFAYLV